MEQRFHLHVDMRAHRKVLSRKTWRYKLDCHIFYFISLPAKTSEAALAEDTDFSFSFGAQLGLGHHTLSGILSCDSKNHNALSTIKNIFKRKINGG